MFIAFLTLLSALSISGVAIFYSVIGLAAIFPGAFVPIIVMGGVLEVGKLVTASWLYRNWQFTPWLLKSYLTLAIVVLSLITSMGIFGFLSKAHVEQNLTSNTVIQRIEIINDKIDSHKVYINRQKSIIERADNSLVRVGGSNTDDIDIEKLNIKNANEKLTTLLAIESTALTELTENLKTLLVVETNTIKDLNVRLSILDADVNALRDKKGLFSGGNHKKAMRLKEAQAPERNKINSAIRRAQGNIQKLKQNHQANINQINERITKLKKEHADEIAKAQANIEKMRGSVSTNKNDLETGIVTAENNIVNAQNSIDDLIIERQPLEATILKLETEVGPIKYIAALAVDWGIASEVNLSKAVRWVIIIIIFVFDPLAVLLLIAANQSLIRRYPPERPGPPQEIFDLEKPDHDLTFDPPKKDPPKVWNSMINEATQAAQKEQLEKATNRLKDWKDKLDKFNSKVPKPEDKPVEIITDEKVKEDDNKKKEFKKRIEEKAKETKEEDLILERPETVSAILPEIKEPKEITQFKPATKTVVYAKPRIIKTMDKPGIPKEIEDRIKPDLTEVIKPEVKPEFENQSTLPTKEERDKILKEFHTTHGDYEDISEDELKRERDEANKAQFLADVSLTEEEARNHPPITESRKAFFQDHIDDILRGNTTFENVPPDIAKTVALLMTDEYPDPQIITKGSALKEEETDLPKMTTEQLVEKFAADPNTENRDISEDELDKLLEGFEEKTEDGKKYKLVIQGGQKVRIPIEDEYIQNEEQKESGNWSKILDIKEPEQNEIILPEIKNTDDFEDRSDEELVNVQPENTISPAKIDRHKKRMISDTAYREKIEERINDLISKIEAKELVLDDLTENDRQVIIDIMNQNG